MAINQHRIPTIASDDLKILSLEGRFGQFDLVFDEHEKLQRPVGSPRLSLSLSFQTAGFMNVKYLGGCKGLGSSDGRIAPSDM